MTKICTAVLYGNSLLLASLGAVLDTYADVQVKYVAAGQPDSTLCLQALQPDVVLFDLATAQNDQIFSLFQAQPDLRSIAVDLAGDRLFVFSGKEFKGLATANLLQAILGSSPHQQQIE